MMRLQRVGRKNDPSFRIVVTDKKTGVKSDKHVDRLGSYNPKTKNFIIDADKARDWISKGVQPSDTMHNLLISKKVIEGKKINVLPKKSPIIDEAKLKAEADAKAKEEADALAAAEAAKAAAEAPAEETPADDVKVDVVADESDPEDHSEVAEEDPEKVAKEAAEKAQAAADAEAD